MKAELYDLASEVAEELVSWHVLNDYVQDAFERNWSPYYLMDGDLEYIRGQQEDSPRGLPLKTSELQEEFEQIVEKLVRDELEDQIDALRAEQE